MPGGGLLELSGHFEIQKVMYGFCSVKDPQAVLPKYVLVNWVSGGGCAGGAVLCPPEPQCWQGHCCVQGQGGCGCPPVPLPMVVALPSIPAIGR